MSKLVDDAAAALQKHDPYPVSDWMRDPGAEHVLGLSQSKIKAFLRCRLLFYWQYVERLASPEISRPLQVGSITHWLIHELYRKEKSLTPQHIEKLPAIVAAAYGGDESASRSVAAESANLVAGYLNKYQNDTITLVDTERYLEIKRPLTAPSQEYICHGVIDGICIYQGDNWQLEHKTAARYDAMYLTGLRNDLQAKFYHQLLINNGYTPRGVLYNLLVKKKVPEYHRQPIVISEHASVQVLRTFDGVATELFAMRDVLRGGAFKDDFPNVFYPDWTSCAQYGRECEFRTLCTKLDQLDRVEKAKVFYRRT